MQIKHGEKKCTLSYTPFYSSEASSTITRPFVELQTRTGKPTLITSVHLASRFSQNCLMCQEIKFIVCLSQSGDVGFTETEIVLGKNFN